MEKLNAWLHNDNDRAQMTNPEDFKDDRTKKEATEIHRMFRERLGEQHVVNILSPFNQAAVIKISIMTLSFHFLSVLSAYHFYCF